MPFGSYCGPFLPFGKLSSGENKQIFLGYTTLYQLFAAAFDLVSDILRDKLVGMIPVRGSPPCQELFLLPRQCQHLPTV
jgi:hypothetical protein